MKRKLVDGTEPSLAATALEQTISSTEDRSPTDRASTSAPLGDRSRYAIESEFARGGLGRILKAHDERLDRPVAIKELLTSGAVLRDRFQREVAITARLQHPSIVPVYDAGGSIDGEPFYVMKLLTNSRTLKDVVAERADLDQRLALLPNLIAVADATAYAHSEQIIHRDLKPSNILIGAFGETVVIDWGLAKDLSLGDQPDELTGSPYRAASAELTMAGSVLGTPQYMAPEQARGEPVDKRADVYALGALLYYVLAGRAPYRGRDSSHVLELVLKEAPPPIADAQPGVPADLRAIVSKAMARDPVARYADAEALAADLRRFQTGQLVSAHDYSNRQLFARWLARHRLPVIISALFTLTLLVAGFAGLQQIVRERDRAEARAHELILTHAESQLEQDPTAAVAWAKSYPLDGADAGHLGSLLADADSRAVARHVLGRESPLMSLAAFSHDSTRVATEEGKRTIRISDVVTGRALTRIAHGGTALAIAWSEDDRSLVVTNWVRDSDSPIELVDVASGRVTRLGATTRNAFGLEVRGDEALVAGAEGTVRLWNLRTDTQRVVATHKSKVSSARFSPDGALVVASDIDGHISIYDRRRGSERTFDAGVATRAVSATPDGRSLIAGQEDGIVARWDLATGERRVLGRHNARVGVVAVSRDGHWAATGSDDRTVRLWNLVDGTWRVLAGHTAPVRAVAFSPTAQLIASAGIDSTVRVWQIESGSVSLLRGHGAAVQQLVFSSDGRWLASAAEDKTTRVWDVAPLAAVRELVGPPLRTIALAHSPDGRFLATASQDRTVRAWALPSGAPLAVHSEPSSPTVVAFSPDGARMAAATETAVVIWDAQSGAEQLRIALAPAVAAWALRFSPDGRRLAVARGDGAVRVFDGASEQRFAGAKGAVRAIAFSRDGASIAAGGDDHTLRLWDLASGVARIVGTHGDVISDVTFSPDGAMLASASWDQTVAVHTLERGITRTWKTTGKLSRVVFSKTGLWLATAATDGLVTLWNVATGQSRSLVGHDAIVLALDFSSDDRWLASAGWDHTLRLWDVAGGQLQQMYRCDGNIYAAGFAVDGSAVDAACEDGIVRRWQVPHHTRADLPDAMRELTTAVLLGSRQAVRTE